MDLTPKHRDRLFEELCEFVRIPSRSFVEGGEEGRLQELVASRMKEAGARVRTFEAADAPSFFGHPLCHRPERRYRDRPTVLGELGPEDAPALLILAHSDTVQIGDPPSWTVDPFCGKLDGERIYGLGTTDDKWGTATLLAIIRALQESGRPLKKRLVFASTIDEEHGIGNGLLLLMLAGIRAEAALYLDGLRMRVCVGNLGGSSLILRPWDDIPDSEWKDHAARLTKAAEEMSRRRAGAFSNPLFRDNIQREHAAIPYDFRDEGGPYFNFAFYTVPGDDRDGVYSEVETAVRTALGKDVDKYSLSCHEPWFEPSLIPVETPLVSHLAESVRSVTGRPPVITTIPKQDAFVLSNHAGIPTVSFGPSFRQMEPGAYHCPDEFITLDELREGCRCAFGAVCRWLEETP